MFQFISSLLFENNHEDIKVENDYEMILVLFSFVEKKLLEHKFPSRIIQRHYSFGGENKT